MTKPIALRLPAWVARFIALTLRYQFRLIAYHLSLVETYPSFDERGDAPVAAAA